MTPIAHLPLRRAIALAAIATLLTACGGGGGDTTDTTASQETAESATSNAMAMSESAAAATTESLKTAQAVVAGGQASQTYACAGGGTAVFTVTGATLAGATNGQLDAGENYTLTYTACRGAAGAAQLDGTMSMLVTAASGAGVTVQTATQGLTATLPQRVVTLNGSSVVSQAIVTVGATTTTTWHWTSSQIQLTSQRNARSGSFTLSGVDVVRSVSSTGGLLSGASGSTALTLDAVLANATWSASVASQGQVSYDTNGVPTAGAWAITLPHNTIGVTLGGGSATITLDHGPDGTIDRTWTVPIATLNSVAA